MTTTVPEIIYARVGDAEAAVQLSSQVTWSGLHITVQRYDEADPAVALRDFGPFRPPAPETQVKMVEWIIDLNRGSERDLLNGRRILRSVPDDPVDSTAANSGELATSEEDYRALRCRSGELIRPLLLDAPDLDGLYPYQRAGVDWLLENRLAVLADDMGLGKTAMALSALRLLVRAGEVRQALIVVPNSLLANWQIEIGRWSPELVARRVMPPAKAREAAWQYLIGRCHILLTAYSQIHQLTFALQQANLDLIICDEAHHIRKLDAAVTRSVRKLDKKRMWAMAGTPVERDSENLASLMSTLDPDRRADIWNLHSRARPFVLRRTKNEVLEQLPSVNRTVEVLELTSEQLSSYRITQRLASQDPERWDPLRLFNQLRTICDYDPDTGASAKIDRIVKILDAIAIAEEKAVVFSYLARPLDLLETQLRKRHIKSVMLSGQRTLEQRAEALDRFRNNPETGAILCSNRVAGEGLTLTEANHVILINEWWNPSSNQQAQNRVVRIGQRRGVRVYGFRMKDTVEERLDVILKRKQEDRKQEDIEELIGRLAIPASARDPQVQDLLTELTDSPS